MILQDTDWLSLAGSSKPWLSPKVDTILTHICFFLGSIYSFLILTDFSVIFSDFEPPYNILFAWLIVFFSLGITCLLIAGYGSFLNHLYESGFLQFSRVFHDLQPIICCLKSCAPPCNISNLLIGISTRNSAHTDSTKSAHFHWTFCVSDDITGK